MSLAREQWDTLELARLETHVANGEPGQIEFLGRNNATNGVEARLVIERAWSYSETQGQLQRTAPYVLNVSELEINATVLTDLVGVRHGDQSFTVVQPSPMRPIGTKRFWVFYLMPAQGEL